MIVKDLFPGLITGGRAFHGAVRAAMGMLDWLVADNANVVIAQQLKNHDGDDRDSLSQLPDELRDPMSVLDREARKANARQQSSTQLSRRPLPR